MTQNNPKVIVASPVGYKIANGKEFFTGEGWFKAILAQNYSPVEHYLLLNDLKPEMEQSLINLTDSSCTIDTLTINDFPDERGKRRKNDKDYTRFSILRNYVLDFVLSTDSDYYVSIDSDIIGHPDLVSRLVTAITSRPGYGMIAAVVNNTRRSGMKLKYPNAVYNFGTAITKIPKGTSTTMRPLTKFKRGAFIDVDYSGACTILDVKMLKENPDVRWGPHKQGEDLYFCEKIKSVGYKIGVDTSLTTLHLMDDTVGEEDRIIFEKDEII